MPQFLAGQPLSAGKLQQLGSSIAAYAPTVQASGTNPNLGTSPTQQGSWTRHGDIVIGRLYISFGSSPSAGSGTYFVTLPVPVLDPGTTKMVVGSGQIIDLSALDFRLVNAYWLSGDNTGRVRVTVGAAGDIRNDNPWTWASGDQIAFDFQYPGDFD